LRINGNVIIHENAPLYAKKKTRKNDIAIITYNTLHTGPKTQLGGANEGFLSVEYHE
jgi:hypothetical protein